MGQSIFNLLALAATAVRASAAGPLLDCFQVTPPVVVPDVPACEQMLMVHSFGLSYGKPFVGMYEPPQCAFNRVILNFTVTSSGRQFDRLGIMYLGDTEVWRTSTAEPTPNGIIWTYMKDMSHYLALWKQPQKLIFDLGNLINDVYTGPFNTTLTATFFTENDGSVPPADVILPISARRAIDDRESDWKIPEATAVTTFAIPRNAKRAVASLSAVGQQLEEFWWGNVLQSDIQTFPNNTLFGYSPFREVQLLIDGTLAGVAWPFPVIFTGGVSPGFWRPIVGIDAYDLQEDEIDITPWLGILSDGKDHTYEIRVAGIANDNQGNPVLTDKVDMYWSVTGKVFIWLDEGQSVTTATNFTFNSQGPSLFVQSSISRRANGTNDTITYQATAQRHLSISSSITTSKGTRLVSWEQNLNFNNTGNVTDGGFTQTNDQLTRGSGTSTGGVEFAKQFEYPLWCWQKYAIEPVSQNVTIDATLDRAKRLVVHGTPVFPTGQELLPHEDKDKNAENRTSTNAVTLGGVSLYTRQNGTAWYTSSPKANSSFRGGATEQLLTLTRIGSGDVPDDFYPEANLLYRRHVLAVNMSLLIDDKTYGEDAIVRNKMALQPSDHNNWVGNNIKLMRDVGRVPRRVMLLQRSQDRKRLR